MHSHAAFTTLRKRPSPARQAALNVGERAESVELEFEQPVAVIEP